MAVTDQIPSITHAANGVSDTFAYDFLILDEADLQVLVDQVEQTLNVDYTVTGVGVDAGGTVVFSAGAPAADTEIVLRRDMQFKRETDYQNAGDFKAATVNQDFDRLIMLLQQIYEEVSRAILLPPGSSLGGLQIPAPDANFLLGWNDAENGIVNIDPASIGVLTLNDGDITTALLANLGVTTEKIADLGVTAGKLAGTLDLSSKNLTLTPSQKSVDYLEYNETQASGTDGGTFTLGAWRTRTLNTEVADTGGHGSLSANEITLAAGTYECWISCPAFGTVGNHRARLYNVTDAAAILNSQVASTQSYTSFAVIVGRFTIASSKVVRVEHRSSGTQATNGFGPATSFAPEIFTVARFWKVG